MVAIANSVSYHWRPLVLPLEARLESQPTGPKLQGARLAATLTGLAHEFRAPSRGMGIEALADRVLNG